MSTYQFHRLTANVLAMLLLENICLISYQKLSYLKAGALGTTKLTSKSRNRHSSIHFLKYYFWIGLAFLSYLSSVRASALDSNTKLANVSN